MLRYVVFFARRALFLFRRFITQANVYRAPIRRRDGGGYAVLVNHPEKHFILPTAILTPAMVFMGR